MAKIKWRGGAMLSPVPPTMVTVSDGERENVFTVAWTGITNTIPPKTYISVRPSRYSHDIIQKSGVFAINLTTEALCRAADYCGVKLFLAVAAQSEILGPVLRRDGVAVAHDSAVLL